MKNMEKLDHMLTRIARDGNLPLLQMMIQSVFRLFTLRYGDPARLKLDDVCAGIADSFNHVGSSPKYSELWHTLSETERYLIAARVSLELKPKRIRRKK